MNCSRRFHRFVLGTGRGGDLECAVTTPNRNAPERRSFKLANISCLIHFDGLKLIKFGIFECKIFCHVFCIFLLVSSVLLPSVICSVFQ